MVSPEVGNAKAVLGHHLVEPRATDVSEFRGLPDIPLRLAKDSS
jgi:hypothetical protein